MTEMHADSFLIIILYYGVSLQFIMYIWMFQFCKCQYVTIRSKYISLKSHNKLTEQSQFKVDFLYFLKLSNLSNGRLWVEIVLSVLVPSSWMINGQDQFLSQHRWEVAQNNGMFEQFHGNCWWGTCDHLVESSISRKYKWILTWNGFVNTRFQGKEWAKLLKTNAKILLARDEFNQ